MLSLVVAYMVANLLYQNRIHEYVQDLLFENAEKMIHAYHSTPTVELIPFIQNFNGMTGTKLQLFDQNLIPLLEEKEEPVEIEAKHIEDVLAGGSAEHIHTGKHMLPIVGVPLQVEGKPYALFLTVKPNSAEGEIMNSIHLMYVIILFFGSFLILIAARFLVRPIVQLTEATKRMAKGHFDFEIPTKRKDEIGVLSRSFNEMAKELGKLDRMRKEFVANVSHEIQSPLTSITGFSKALRQKKLTEENQDHYLAIIEEESERLSRLSRNLLRLSSLQHEQAKLTINSYRLDEQLRNVIISLEPQWNAKKMDLVVDLDTMIIQADEDLLKQVWINLLNNGINFTPEHGKLIIRGKKADGKAVVSIIDNGIGIPEEERSDIFKPLYKVDKSRNSSVKGNGLGLSIVKQIVDLHGGEIGVSGRTDSTGAIFTIYIPVDQK